MGCSQLPFLWIREHQPVPFPYHGSNRSGGDNGEGKENRAKSSLSSPSGFYSKPSLSADQSVEVLRGETVSLQCTSAHVPFDRFSLTKEGGATVSQSQSGGHQGSFVLGPVNQSFSGNYRCYGWYRGSPYVWSAPSDALGLVVTGRCTPAQPCVLLLGALASGRNTRGALRKNSRPVETVKRKRLSSTHHLIFTSSPRVLQTVRFKNTWSVESGAAQVQNPVKGH